MKIIPFPGVGAPVWKCTTFAVMQMYNWHFERGSPPPAIPRQDCAMPIVHFFVKADGGPSLNVEHR